MPLTCITRFDVVPERAEAFLSVLNDVLKVTRDAAPSAVKLDHGGDDPPHFTLYETWPTHEQLPNTESQCAYHRAWQQAMPALLRHVRCVRSWQTEDIS
jgi:quinol monooxygenase YgiN